MEIDISRSSLLMLIHINNRPHSTFAGLTPEEVYYGGNSNALKPKNNKFAA
ncbi:hypothetical protein [Candidatus Bandiella numerosa]|uniref:hypothetical protein n=1 Tax=Candidatus Bandiella numerosa TaxID=2570586 RepID=UPI001F43A104|nr:hypothetical protein [Candidatus Bandiella numerosa]